MKWKMENGEWRMENRQLRKVLVHDVTTYH